MRSRTNTVLLRCGLVVIVGVLAPRSAGAAPAVESLTARIRELVVTAEPPTATALAAMVERGLPPAGLAVLLDAARSNPRVDLLPVLVELCSYRRPEIRARALAARAALGGVHADAAVSQAADDVERGVRRLAVVLGRTNPSPVTERVVADLMQADPSLAAEFDADAGLIHEAPPAAPDPKPVEDSPAPTEPEAPALQVDPGTPEPTVYASIDVEERG